MLFNVMNTSLLSANSLVRRCLCISARLNLKFKLTDEQIEELGSQKKEKVKRKPRTIKPESPPSLATKENSLIMAKVSSERYRDLIKVAVPKHRLNTHLLLYVRENDSIQAHDPERECQPGDWVLLRRQTDPVDDDVHHVVEKVIHRYGNWVDPITGKRSLGLYYDEDFKQLEKIKVTL